MACARAIEPSEQTCRHGVGHGLGSARAELWEGCDWGIGWEGCDWGIGYARVCRGSQHLHARLVVDEIAAKHDVPVRVEELGKGSRPFGSRQIGGG